MLQLTYTSCRAKQSVSGATGFQVRACSAGFDADRMRRAVAVTRYELPDGIPANAEARERAPVRLAYLEVPGLGRVLCHSVYVGLEPSGNRFGNFFSHLVTGLPSDFDARRAIETWRGLFWQKEDGGGATQLDEVSLEELVPGELSYDAAQDYLNTEAGDKLFRFVLGALFTRRADQRIFLAARAQDVALCIYACSLVLPPSLLRDLTFSTYEKSPLNCAARIVAVYWDPGFPKDLPSACYSGSGIGYNTFSGQQTPLQDDKKIVELFRKIIDLPDEIREEFLRRCERTEFEKFEQLALYSRYSFTSMDKETKLTQAESEIALAHPPLAKFLICRDGVLDQILSWARTDSKYFLNAWPKIGTALRDILPSKPNLLDESDGLSLENMQVVKAWLAWDQFISFPNFEPDLLRDVAQAIAWMPEQVRSDQANELARKAAQGLFGEATNKSVRNYLEDLLITVGPEIPDGPGGLYRLICQQFRQESYRIDQRPLLLLALVKIGLSGGRVQELTESLAETQIGEVDKLIKEVRRRPGGRKALRMLRIDAKSWGGNARRILRRINPRPWREFLWDNRWWVLGLLILLAVLGGGGALIYWYWFLSRPAAPSAGQ